MNGRLLGSVIIMWLMFSLIAVLNGGFRNSVLTPQLGEAASHVLSTVLLCMVIFAGSWYLTVAQHVEVRSLLLQIGVMWLVGTVVFEFVFGYYIIGRPWEHLLADYDLLRGRVWVFVLLTELFGPLVASRLQAARRTAS